MRFPWQKKRPAPVEQTEERQFGLEAGSGNNSEEQRATAADEPAVLSEQDVKMLHKLAVSYENSVEYLNLRQNALRMTWVNFLAGIAKGLGFAFGFTVLAFLALYILKSLSILNLPLIGDFISDLLSYIEDVRRIG